MKIIILLSSLFSFSAFSNEVTGDLAREMFNNLKGYEYSSGAITSILNYQLTVRHNQILECKKEETTFKNDKAAEVTYSCNITSLNCSDVNQNISLQLVSNEISTQIIYNGQALTCLSLEMKGNDIVCSGIDFETAGAVIANISPDQNATLYIMPGPGNGKIEHFDLTCNSVK